MRRPAWLTSRPIAHRGLHAEGIAENSIGAALAAIARSYAIECDVQASRDGEAIVFHDSALDRLTSAKGDIATFAAAELAPIAYREGATLATLSEFLAAVGGRVPLFVDIKSRFEGDMRLATRVAQLAASYSGPLALQSFDPQILIELRRQNVPRPLGLIAQAGYEDWKDLGDAVRQRLAQLTDFASIVPDFLAWRAADLPHAVPLVCRAFMPVLAWTLRDAQSRSEALRWADQVFFEGFAP